VTQKQNYVALKIVKSAQHYTDAALDEIKLLSKVMTASTDHPGKQHVVNLLDNFTVDGVHGHRKLENNSHV
jgi:serine/threonine-protein kinase SRPK3